MRSVKTRPVAASSVPAPIAMTNAVEANSSAFSCLRSPRARETRLPEPIPIMNPRD